MSGDGPSQAPGGVFVFRGSPINISKVAIELDAQGNLSRSTAGLQGGLEMWPMWIRVAIEHEASAARARRDLIRAWDGADGEARGELLMAETRACLVTISATAFALDSMAISAATRARLPTEIGRTASSARRIAEVLKQCLVMTESQFLQWRQSAIQIFDARNEAVHPPAGAGIALPHPAIAPLVPRPVHVFRVENANAAVTTALSMAQLASSAPKPRLGRQFREGVAPWADFVRSLRALREPLLPIEQ